MADAEDFLTRLAAATGVYSGTGLNHENETFTGLMVVRPVTGGVLTWFRASGASGETLHEETVLIGPSLSRGLALTSLSGNVPYLQHFELAEATPERSVFTHGDFDNPRSFRERLTLGLQANALSYAFEWGMPGEAVAPRSSVAMTRVDVTPPADCPILKA